METVGDGWGRLGTVGDGWRRLESVGDGGQWGDGRGTETVGDGDGDGDGDGREGDAVRIGIFAVYKDSQVFQHYEFNFWCEILL